MLFDKCMFLDIKLSLEQGITRCLDLFLWALITQLQVACDLTKILAEGSDYRLGAAGIPGHDSRWGPGLM